MKKNNPRSVYLKRFGAPPGVICVASPNQDPLNAAQQQQGSGLVNLWALGFRW